MDLWTRSRPRSKAGGHLPSDKHLKLSEVLSIALGALLAHLLEASMARAKQLLSTQHMEVLLNMMEVHQVTQRMHKAKQGTAPLCSAHSTRHSAQPFAGSDVHGKQIVINKFGGASADSEIFHTNIKQNLTSLF